jgi:hypothetical protein
MMRVVKVALNKRTVCFLGLALGLGMTSCAGTPLPPASATSATSVTPPLEVLAVTAPDAAWRLRIERIFELDAEVWILARLERPPGPAAQVIGPVQVTLPVALPAKTHRVFIAGKTWSWPNPEPCEFVPSLAPVVKQAGKARVLYSEDGTR